MYFEIHKNPQSKQPYRWVIKSANHRILCASENYTHKQDCINAVNIIKQNAASAPFYDETGEV